MRIVDASTGDQKVVLREALTSGGSGETFFRFSQDTNEVLWSSERDG